MNKPFSTYFKLELFSAPDIVAHMCKLRTELDHPQPPAKDVRQLAMDLYDVYRLSVGTAWDGRPLPDAAEFFADPSKQRQANGWMAAADYAILTSQLNQGALYETAPVDESAAAKVSRWPALDPAVPFEDLSPADKQYREMMLRAYVQAIPWPNGEPCPYFIATIDGRHKCLAGYPCAWLACPAEGSSRQVDLNDDNSKK